MTKFSDTNYLVDLGRNIAGVVEVKLHAIVVSSSELFMAKGSLENQAGYPMAERP